MSAAVKLDPLTIPKYVNKLEKPPVFEPYEVKHRTDKRWTDRYQIQHHYTIYIDQTYQQMLPPGYPMTKVFGYGGI